MKIFFADKTFLSFLQSIILIVSALIVILAFNLIPIYMLMLIVCILFSAAGIFTVFIYLPLWFSHLRYYVGEKSITKRSGAFFTNEQTIKYSSIQYSSIITGPFSRITGLNFIIIYV